MIRFAAIALVFLAAAAPASAQEPDLPDVRLLATAPRVDLADPLPLFIQQAIATSEDARFFDRFPALSPISQSLARNMPLSPQRTLTRRTMEMRLGAEIANTFSSEDILTMFGQTIYLGRSCYGFENALQHRLGVALEDATLRDALTLAALIKAPMRFEDLKHLAPRFEFLASAGEQAGFWDLATVYDLYQAGPSPFLDASCPLE